MDTPYWSYHNPVAELQFKFALVFEKFQFPSKFGWKINFLYFLNDLWVLLIYLNRS